MQTHQNVGQKCETVTNHGTSNLAYRS